MMIEQRRGDSVEVSVADVQLKIGELRRAWTGNHSKSPGLERLNILEGNLWAKINPGVVMEEVESLVRVFGDPAVGDGQQESY